MSRLGDLEAAIMDVVWNEARPLRVREVLETMASHRPVAYTTVQTVMDILYRKGWLLRAKRGRVNYYEAARSRQDYIGRLMDEALSVAENRTLALVKFVQGMDPDEVDVLRRTLASARAAEPGP